MEKKGLAPGGCWKDLSEVGPSRRPRKKPPWLGLVRRVGTVYRSANSERRKDGADQIDQGVVFGNKRTDGAVVSLTACFGLFETMLMLGRDRCSGVA
jgi:hypothetical protein